jgi:thiamine biosynthesis lipoprotein
MPLSCSSVTDSKTRQVCVEASDFGWTGYFEAMGGPCEVLIESTPRRAATAATKAVAAEAWRIEDKFSRYLSDNIVHRINTAGGKPVSVDDETARLLDFAATLYELSDGRFDITSGVLREVWHFDGSDRVPQPDKVAAMLERIGWDRVAWDPPVIALRAGMQIDLGGIGKEYAVDRCIAVLKAGIDVPGLVNFGGDLAATGAPRARTAWKVAIEGPQDGTPERLLDLRQGAIATSGDARRFLVKNGVRYGHILDPTTGWPIAGAPTSVTVAADTCTQAGMLSTLAMLRGADAESFLASQSVRYWCQR